MTPAKQPTLVSSLILIGVILVLAVMLKLYALEKDREDQQRAKYDSIAISRLSALARAMIRENSHSTGITDGLANESQSACNGQNAVDVVYITSFQAFFDYVAKNVPRYASSADASNPFPGILPGNYYERLSGRSRHPSDILISTTIYRSDVGQYRYELWCDGIWTLAPLSTSEIVHKNN